MAIQFASGALKSRDTPQSQWEDAIVAVRVNDIAVQDTTPTGTEHIWVDTDDPGEVVVPTIEDHNVLANAIGIVVDGNKSALGATAGQYVILQNSTITGKDDGLYTAAQTIPANTVIDGTYLTAVSGGGLNALKDNNIPEFFNETSRHASASLGAVQGVYFPNTRFVVIQFYFGANSNVGTDTLFTIAQKYRPNSTTTGSGVIGQSTSAGNVLAGNVSINSSGEIKNIATTTCYKCYGTIFYTI